MLVAGTISSVKVFHLRCKNINTLKVSKLQVPISIGGSGARTAKFSPDGKWLLLIRPDSNLHIYRLTWDGGPKIRPSLRPKATILKRLFRDQAKEQVRCGSLGNYERSIHRVAFSADSKILAVGDLSGYIDSWILEGHEDLTHDNDEAMVVKSPKSSDEESADEEIHPNVILGQSWIRNPAASHLARLETAPLVLSFRPPRPKVDSKGGSNDKFVHSTRNTPYPCSHDLPNDDRLFTITGNHRMYEFTIRTGRLSEWSRRNFSPSLPSSFRDIMDRAMGLIWDISMQKERVWIYGTSWLWMFDLSKDFSNRALNEYKNAVDELSSIPNGTNKRKRKRKPTDEGPEEVRKRTSGAGGQKTSAKLDIGIGRKFRKIDGPDLASSRWINADAEQSQASDDDNYDDDDDDDDDDVATQPAVNNSRRKSGGKAQLYDNFTGDIASSDSEARLDGHNPQTDLPYWGTHRYRDILGIVPLMDRHEHVDKLPRRVEVALVERLILEVDLPPKYHSNQERND